MSYQIIIESNAEKQIYSFEAKTSDKIVNAISKLSENPRPSGVKKLQIIDGYRIRLGSIRILYKIDDFHRILTIYKITNRKDVYKSK